ncbi:MAG: hypothetical protein ACYTG6_01115 [Planctomycetota bacterium]
MRALRWTAWVLTALCFTVVVLATAPAAVADDEEVTTVETTHEAIFVTTPDGRVVRLVKDEDGAWQAVPVGEEGEASGEGHFRLEGLHPGTVRLFVPEDVEEEEVTSEDPAPEHVRRLLEQLAGAGAGPSDANGTPRNPMPTILRWLMRHANEAGASGRCPIESWFEGGSSVPLADLRDALRSDGWSAPSLRQWLHGMVGAHSVPGMSSPGGHGQGNGHWGPMMWGPPWGGMNPWGMPGWGQMHRRGPMFMTPWGVMPGSGWSSGPFGQMGGVSTPQTTSRTILMWNDGSGWQRRELPSQGAGVMPNPFLMGPGGMFPGAPGSSPMHFFGAGGGTGTQQGGACDCENCPGRTQSTEGGAEQSWLQLLPPEVRNVIGGMTTTEVAPVTVVRRRGPSSCSDCPGGTCGSTTTTSCTCEGECDCPRIIVRTVTGRCDGNCSGHQAAVEACACEGECTCPQAEAGVRACPGDCDGGCEDCPCRSAAAEQPTRVIRRVIRVEPAPGSPR